MNLPTGTVTFLFTDIEGSTKLWEAYPETMRSALARHDALIRRAIADSQGYVFKTIGDAFCAAFANAAQALEATLSAQLALTAEPWPEETPLKVRMALHTGAVESRDDDYFGPPVNRVARLLSTAHGEQVVVSAATQELVRDYLPPLASLRSLGEHRLKDLGRPESIFQLIHPGLVGDFPPLRSLTNPELQHNLPQQTSSFVGRETQIVEVKALLGKTRLLTLVGAGGAGKTRLSLQVAADLLDGSGDGVWLVELAPLTDPGLVASTVAGVLGVKEEAGKPIQQTLAEHLRDKHLLLILDNCEHLLNACAKLADTLLRNCPRVLILASSREALAISGEQTYRVPSLSLPNPTQSQTPESVSSYEAVRLFIDRALQVQSTFAVTNQNAPALASICHRLDGIPLAIELAAARVRSLAVEEINARLDQRFRLLTGGSRTALPRQQTLRSLIDWSYDLLNDAEKALLCRLSVFLGGWTLEAAEAVCVGEPVEDWEALDLLTSLCDKSLVVADHQEGASRFGMLETVRQYARDRLSEGGEGEALRDRHLSYFVGVVEATEPLLKGADQQMWLARLDTEHDNLRTALEWSQEASEGDGSFRAPRPELGLRMAGSLLLFWSIRGYLAEGRRWLEGARLHRSINIRVRAKALNAAGGLAVGQWDHPAARSLLEEALALWREVGDQASASASLSNLGNLALGQEDYATARSLHEESLRILRGLGSPASIATKLNNLACVEIELANYEAAVEHVEESLAIHRRSGNRIGASSALTNLGLLARQRGDHPVARSLWAESLTIARDIGDMNTIPNVLRLFAALHSFLGEPERGARLWGAAERLRERTGGSIPPRQLALYEQEVASACAALGDDAAFDAAWQAGRALTTEQAIDLALGGPND